MSKTLSGSFFFVIVGLVLWYGASSKAQMPRKYQCSSSMRFAAATCTQFSWISDLPSTSETVALLKHGAVDGFGLPFEKTDFWSNGSAEEFLGWLKELAEKGKSDSTLIFYFSTLQLKD